MKILYHIPSLDTIYAGRPIYYGYKHAFEDMGHTFRPLTADDNQKKVMDEYAPDILFTSMGPYTFKYLDLDILKKQKKKGMKVFINTPFWKSVFAKTRISEVSGLVENKGYLKLITSGDFGDVYYNCLEQGDVRMEGFQNASGYPCHTVLLAVDQLIEEPTYSEKFACDVSFIGTYLPEKREFIQKHLFPLKNKYDVKIYGRDWTAFDRILNFSMKVGQYYNIPYLRSFKKFKPTLEEERELHRSSTIALNIHNHKIGLDDLNERTFKIPASGGFEIVDNVPTLHKYFKDGVDITIAKNTNDWFDKIEFYIKNPDQRLPIIKAGKEKVLKEHTYHNRVRQLLTIYESIV